VAPHVVNPRKGRGTLDQLAGGPNGKSIVPFPVSVLLHATASEIHVVFLRADLPRKLKPSPQAHRLAKTWPKLLLNRFRSFTQNLQIARVSEDAGSALSGDLLDDTEANQVIQGNRYGWDG